MSFVPKSQNESSRSSRGNTRGERRFTLEVRQGKTSHRLRPLPQGRLSVGSGNKSWLRLGGREMPEILAWLEVGPREISLYVFEENPPILVNNAPVRYATLRGGELLLIGTFEFMIHCYELDPHETPFNPPHLEAGHMARLSEIFDRPLSDHTPEELIDLIQIELNKVDQYEAGERAGMHSLLAAVEEAREEILAEEEQPTIPFPTRVPVEEAPEFSSLLDQLRKLTASLVTDQNQPADGGHPHLRLSDPFVLAQKEIIEQLERLIEATPEDFDEDEGDYPLRARA